MSLFFLHPTSLERSHGDEYEAAQEVFGEDSMGSLLTSIPAGSVVLPRYRSIPFGEELEGEVRALGSSLINSYREHRAIADLFSWVGLLEGLTPPAYRLEDIPHLPEGAYFVKGETNSVKNSWATKAFAPTREDVPRVALALLEDSYVGSQEVAIRPFQSYRQIATSVDGRPVFHERRVFTYRGEVLSEAFYWSSHPEVANTTPKRPEAYREALNEALLRVKDLAPFVVVDMAEYEDGSWGVVELNDGCMSGLSDNAPATVWRELARAVARRS